MLLFCRCCSCCLPENQVHFDNCCQCNTATIRKLTGLDQFDLIYADYHNSVSIDKLMYINVQYVTVYILVFTVLKLKLKFK
jgi:hypothetical protein